MRVLFAAAFLVVVGCMVSCGNKSNDLQGTWRLLSETKIENGDTTFTVASPGQPMIKIINDTHFSFLRHDLTQGKDSATALFVAGGGKYEFDGKKYIEHLEYCNFREWENHTFNFEVTIGNDTLVQQGREKVEGAGIDRIIVEKYARVSN